MKLFETPSGNPKMPSVVSHMWSTKRLSEAPRWEMKSGMWGPAKA